MKAMVKVLGFVLTLGLVILTVFHLVMLYGLTQAMREVVLPRLKQETGIDAKVGRLSINVAAGQLFLDDVAILNPEGFLLENMASVDRIEVTVDVKSLLLQKPLIVKSVEMENALVNVIRNQAGEINFNALEERLPPSRPVETGPVPEPGKPPCGSSSNPWKTGSRRSSETVT